MSYIYTLYKKLERLNKFAIFWSFLASNESYMMTHTFLGRHIYMFFDQLGELYHISPKNAYPKIFHPKLISTPLKKNVKKSVSSRKTCISTCIKMASRIAKVPFPEPDEKIERNSKSKCNNSGDIRHQNAINMPLVHL